MAAFRSGDVVEVRSPAEILATLDASGACEALPFMPSMLQHCGHRFVVDKRADKVCDTIDQGGCRRLPETLLLAELRCDGTGFDGCQADCRLYWKEAWLRRAEPDARPPPATDDGARQALVELLSRNGRNGVAVDGSGAGSYRCQATEMSRASTRVGTKDPRGYLREVISGNVTPGRFLRVMPRAFMTEVRFKLGLLPEAEGRPRVGKRALPDAGAPTGGGPPEARLDLEPGEWVQVRPLQEIVATLNPAGRNRGLWFDREMIPYCGKVFRVRQRIRRFINEKDGRMLEMKTAAVTLEGAVCSGDHSLGRWFCPRAILPFWREAWLRRVENPPASGGNGASVSRP